jgi:hypothetical protein
VNNLIKEEFFREYSTSSNIAKIEYDDDTFEMDITFQNGAVYKYFYVPTYEFDRFISSESHGQFFHAFIKNEYAYEKLVDWS